jgi:exopolysaccharide biosynthesis polyprenyl glycosylphosphotransferase
VCQQEAMSIPRHEGDAHERPPFALQHDAVLVDTLVHVGGVDEATLPRAKQIRHATSGVAASEHAAFSSAVASSPLSEEASINTMARRRRRASLVPHLLAFADAFAVVSVYAVMARVGFAFLHQMGVATTTWAPQSAESIFVATMVIIQSALFFTNGLYAPEWTHSIFHPARFLKAFALVVAVQCAAYVLLAPTVPRGDFLVLLAANLGALSVTRGAGWLATRWLFRRRVLVVGSHHAAQHVMRLIQRQHRHRLALVAHIPTEGQPSAETGMPREAYTLDTNGASVPPREVPITANLAGEVLHEHIDIVVIALTPDERQMTSHIIAALAHLPVHVYVVPDVVTETAHPTCADLNGMPLVGITETNIVGWHMVLKRTFDIVSALLVLTVLGPIMVVIGILIRLDSPGPALFKQERIGQHNRRFVMFKFRTMYVDAEKRAQEVLQQTTQGVVHKQRGDPRVTRFGRLLRRTSLDELPQFLNILLNDMSLIGPRPELPWLVKTYHAWQYQRLLTPQGITGWWQVNGRSERVMHLHSEDDIYYVAHYALGLDAHIVAKTLREVLTGKGAF